MVKNIDSGSGGGSSDNKSNNNNNNNISNLRMYACIMIQVIINLQFFVTEQVLTILLPRRKGRRFLRGIRKSICSETTD